jgi:hypothetical protein
MVPLAAMSEFAHSHPYVTIAIVALIYIGIVAIVVYPLTKGKG